MRRDDAAGRAFRPPAGRGFVHMTRETDLIESRWSELASLLRGRWLRLTDADVAVPDGHRDYLIAQLQKRYGWDREQAEDEVEQLEDTLFG